MLIKMMFWISWREWEDDGLIPCRNRISKYKMVKEKDGGRDQSLQLLLTKSPLAFALIPIRMKSILTTQKIDLGLDYLTLLNHQSLLHTFSNSTKKSVSLNWLQAIIEKHAISTQDLLAINQQLIEAKEYLNANVSSQLVLERIVLNLIK